VKTNSVSNTYIVHIKKTKTNKNKKTLTPPQLLNLGKTVPVPSLDEERRAVIQSCADI